MPGGLPGVLLSLPPHPCGVAGGLLANSLYVSILAHGGLSGFKSESLLFVRQILRGPHLQLATLDVGTRHLLGGFMGEPQRDEEFVSGHRWSSCDQWFRGLGWYLGRQH
jgi:hypothetical protein